MLKVLDIILRLGGIVFILFVVTALVLAFLQERFPVVNRKLKQFFNTDIGLAMLSIISIWAALGAAYTVTFH